jgi:hypothetical protein
MKFTNEGAEISVSPQEMLAAIDQRLGVLYIQNGSANAEARQDLLAQRSTWQRLADDELIARWRYTHALHIVHRRKAAEHDETLRVLAPVYQAATRRAQKRWDADNARALTEEFKQTS